MTVNDFLQEWNSPSETLLVHTSGSTGKPKPMWVEKQRMLNSAHITCDFLGLRPGDSALLCMSLDYIAGKMMVVRSIERKLRLFSVKPSGHPLSDESLAKMVEMDFDFVAMVPMQVYNTLQVPQERERLSRIKHLIIGGGAIDDALAEELRSLPGAVWSTYGMTETLSHIALRRLNGEEASEWYQPFDSVGVSLNSDGCLVIDAPLVCSEPLVTNDIAEIKQQETSSHSSDASSSLKTSSPHVLFRIKGRKDNVICSGGIKIQIEEVENLLRQHLDAPFLLAKKKDEKFGEIAVLVTESGDLEGVEAICRQVLPKYWVPRQYLHFDQLPMTETGKPKRAIF
ncbi:MAG: O-succinylbenzoic acid--CoA ligase [Prevotella sp.]|uniref:AMP-binding protein n=1 Tax=Prevotella sp. TaxID=59823 RepID=UPI00033D3F5D|nr:O-succinylbenzoic acid--CoA ligase [Prevotella sp.]CDD17645.1 o-succinylbenzoic acid--CoA ligase [Prevotella sp. CAG:732]